MMVIYAVTEMHIKVVNETPAYFMSRSSFLFLFYLFIYIWIDWSFGHKNE